MPANDSIFGDFTASGTLATGDYAADTTVFDSYIYEPR
jgi:hypothetical protein